MIQLRFPDKIAYNSRRDLISGATRVVRRADGSIAAANSEHLGAGIRTFDLQQAIQGRTDFEQVQAFHLNARGMGREFRFKDYWDFQGTNEDIDISNGGPNYQLRKAYWLTSDPPGIDTVSLLNFSSSGVIGSAASTVDIAQLIKINQTSAGIVLSLPNPTDTTGGKMVTIANVGTRPFSLLGVYVEPKTSRAALWDGANWTVVNSVEMLYVIYRKIKKPVLGTLTLYLNGLPKTTISSNLIPANALAGIGYDVFNSQLFNESVTLSGVDAAINYETGEIRWLTTAIPRPGIDVLTASYQFDIAARFNSDRFPSAARNFEAFENSFEIIEQVNPEDVLNPTVNSVDSQALATTDLTFSGGANLTNVGTVWSNVSGSGGYGLGNLSLAASQNGWIQFTVTTTGTVLGFNVQNIADKYNGGISGSNGYEYGVYLDANNSLAYAVENGAAISPNVSAAINTGDLVRVARRFGFLYIEKSSDNGSTWTLLHNFSVTNSGALYPNLHLDLSAAQCSTPKIAR